MNIVFYSSSRVPVEDFIDKQPIAEQAKIAACLKSIMNLGLNEPRVEFRQIRGKLWELKIRGEDSAFRIFYVLLNSKLMILLHAYKKQSQKAPVKEIIIAQQRLNEVLRNESLYFRSVHSEKIEE